MTDNNSNQSNEKCTYEDPFKMENNPLNNIKKVIGVMSGKGGVGKSTISVLLAKELNKKGFKVGILDADITGPSIPKLLNLGNERATQTEQYIVPVTTEDGIKVMSLNLLIQDEEEPVIWRGPVIANTVKQFWTDVLWEELDYLIIDMPPGTGDVALTAMQSFPIDGIVMVSIPQDLVSMIVAKAINMTRKMNIKVIGLVENMSYIVCPDCKTEIRIFDNSNTQDFLSKMDIELIGELPMSKEIIDVINNKNNNISEELDGKFKSLTQKVIDFVNYKEVVNMKIAVASEGENVSGHFGFCEGFTIYDVEKATGSNKEFVKNPGHKPGYLPVFLKELNVNIIIAGGMGETAQQLFNENGIEVVVGVQGLCNDAVQKYIDGELKSTGSVCTEHEHEGHCE
ncbi:MAG: P-loop NTPase [Clostridium sp.]|uniref:P-loop NTPase n=1 Tax=Clostridium sp. TaxID=1506 RepID=UPI003D6CAF5C